MPLTVNGYVRGGGQFSGGTYHSAINAFARARQTMAAAKQRRRSEPRAAGRKIHSAPARVRRDPELGGWTVPMPTIDGPHRPPLCRRPGALRARLLLRPQLLRQAPRAGGRVGGRGRGGRSLAPLPPTRKLLLKVKSPGEGPDAERRAQSWFKVRFVGEGGGERVVTEVSGGDPGYGETSKMLAESALCLAFDELPETAGQVTTATAMGDALTARLQRAGISFELLSSTAA